MAPVRLNDLGFNRHVSRPGFAVPALACDAHMHVNGPYHRFPLRETRELAPPEATAEDYRRTASALGLQRCVIVQPSYFAKDNSCTLSAVNEIGIEARAVVVIDPDCSDTELRRFHDAGARGVRLQTVVAGGTDPVAARELADKLAPLGWHIQLFVRESQLGDIVPVVETLPVPVVFDHMAHLDEGDGEDGPNFRLLLKLLERERCWVKLSNAFFTPSGTRARALIQANPDRVVWGSDWPHVAFNSAPPDDGLLLDMLAAWAGDAEVTEKILSRNPDRLYFS